MEKILLWGRIAVLSFVGFFAFTFFVNMVWRLDGLALWGTIWALLFLAFLVFFAREKVDVR
ncbi:MAG: hypothetical protein Q8P86_03820 [bacterium]|nr:hypothetical protein [bacterium]